MLTSEKRVPCPPFSDEAQPSRSCLRPLREIDPSEGALYGGKAANLALLLRAGFQVPDGFCISSAFREEAKRRRGPSPEPEKLRESEQMRELLAAYHALGAGLVAVRSSAAAEDGAEHSFAGQQETILGVQGDQPLIDAVERCFASWESRRAEAYRARQGVEPAGGMAVIVQRLVLAEVAGVLFTHDPLDPMGKDMLAEAAWGLGEVVVSGRVTPDRFWIDRRSLTTTRHEIGTKPVCLTAGGFTEIERAQQSQPCLDDARVRELGELGRRVEALYGAPRDIEWAFAAGKLWLLQARPVTTATAFDREQIRRAEAARLQAQAVPTGTVWARYNLAEVLPAPMPMTWGVMRHFLSGRGGYGLMFRDLGFDPDPELDDEGFIDLVCGRPYVNLSREPKLYFRDFPFGYDFAALKQEPAAALYPQPGVNVALATGRTWLRLPAIILRMLRAHSRMRRQMVSFAQELRTKVFPQFAADVAGARSIDVAGLALKELHARFEYWRQRTLVDFARFALRPSIFAATAMTNLENGLASIVGKAEAPVAVRNLLTGVRPDPDADLAGALLSVQRGELSRDDFLRQFGHRGPSEMELSKPRWSEDPAGLPRAADPSAATQMHLPCGRAERWIELRRAHSGAAARLDRLEPVFREACEFLALRESAKHYLLLGYALIRHALVQIDRRLGLNGGIFFLVPEELSRLIAGEAFAETIAARRKERQTALSIEMPAVIFSDDLEAIGRSAPPGDGTSWQGTPVSAGIAEGPALVLSEPDESATAEGFILVCPSTDPAWVPLFLRAAGLVMETGGILSHGAIVAREFGLPAVVGIPDVQRRLRTGQRVQVDGNSGRIQVLDESGEKPGR